MAMKGKIAKIIADKKCGFIKPDDGSEDCFVSLNALPKGAKEGDEVEFEAGTAPAGKKRPALKVRVAKSAASAPAAKEEVEAPEAPKLVRLKILPERTRIESFTDRYILDIFTFDESGKKPEQAAVRFRADEQDTLINAETGAEIARNVKFYNLDTGSGSLALEIAFLGLVCNTSFTHLVSTEAINKQLVYR